MCAQDDEGFILWESKAILRYIAGKHGLESWYPADIKKRATCDLQMDFFGNTFYSVAGIKNLYPACFGHFFPADADAKATEVLHAPKNACSRETLQLRWQAARATPLWILQPHLLHRAW